MLVQCWRYGRCPQGPVPATQSAYLREIRRVPTSRPGTGRCRGSGDRHQSQAFVGGWEATTDNESYGSVRVSQIRMLDDLTAGQVLGRYELLLPIAKGGMASVWAARLRGTRGFQKMVAIKTMLPGLVDDLHFERMFLDEASLASQVRHPHVIEILDLGEVDRILYLVMEWVDGEPLN